MMCVSRSGQTPSRESKMAIVASATVAEYNRLKI